MALRFQRRVQLFPGVRLNFSGGGLSVTLGVPGASVNLGPRGQTLNLGIPGTGLSYRQRLGSAGNGRSSPGTPNGFDLAPREAPLPPPLPFPQPTVQVDPASEIKSAEVAQLTSPDLAGLKRLLLEASTTRAQFRREAEEALDARDGAWRAYQRAAKFPLSLVSKSRLPRLKAAYEEAEATLTDAVAAHDSCQVAVDFAFDDAAMQAWKDLSAAHQRVSQCAVVWDVTSQTAIDRVKTRSAAARAINRTKVRLWRGGAAVVASRWQGLCFGNANGEDIEIFPGFCLVRQRVGTDFALLDIRDLTLEAWPQRFIEDESIPAGTPIIDKTWEKVNRDGGRDRRFANNREIPVVSYGRFDFSSRTGLREGFMASSPDPVLALGAAFGRLQAAHASMAKRAAKEEIGASPSWSGVAPSHGTASECFQVPPLPAVSGAHGYTVAAAVAAAVLLVVGLLLAVPPRVPNAPTEAARGPEQVAAPALPPTPMPTPAATPLASPSASPVEAVERVVTRAAANVRTGPRGDAPVAQTLASGTTLRVHGRSGNWVHVGQTEPIGWVHGSLLDAQAR